MSDQDKTKEELVEAFATFVFGQMKAKAQDPRIVDALAEKGIERETAEAFVSKCRVMYRQARRKAGGKEMIVGGLWCVGGLVVTAITYSMASSRGGTYIVTWGAVIFGAIQFFRGLFVFISA
jgi:hypothetical protein